LYTFDVPASRPPPGSFEALLHHADAVAAIERTLRKYGLRDEALEDGRQDVLADALEWKGDRPTTLVGVVCLCTVIAHRTGVDALRRKKTGEKHGYAGTTDVTEEHAIPVGTRFDQLDVKRALELLMKVVPAHEMETFAAIAAGVKQSTIGERDGVPARQVRKGLEFSRLRAHKALIAAGFGALLVAGMVILYVKQDLHPELQALPSPSASASVELAHGAPHPASSAAMDAGARVSPEDALAAAEWRRKAFEEVDAGRWGFAATDFEEAAKLDPAGEKLPGVEATHEQAEREAEAKVAPHAPPPSKPVPAPSSVKPTPSKLRPAPSSLNPAP
jgi:DNA-directed RNA polymerase specialized sigma24 family protein